MLPSHSTARYNSLHKNQFVQHIWANVCYRLHFLHGVDWTAKWENIEMYFHFPCFPEKEQGRWIFIFFLLHFEHNNALDFSLGFKKIKSGVNSVVIYGELILCEVCSISWNVISVVNFKEKGNERGEQKKIRASVNTL